MVMTLLWRKQTDLYSFVKWSGHPTCHLMLWEILSTGSGTDHNVYCWQQMWRSWKTTYLLLTVSRDDIMAWIQLAQVTPASVMLFNCRRSKEILWVLLQCYAQCANTVNNDTYSSLSQWEQALCQKLRHMEIQEKRGRKVPILLLSVICEATDLAETRSAVGVSSNNEYVFACPSTMWDAMFVEFRQQVQIRESNCDHINQLQESCGNNVVSTSLLFRLDFWAMTSMCTETITDYWRTHCRLQKSAKCC